MRALLTPEIAPIAGVVLFRPGSELMWLFRQGRVVIETPGEQLADMPSGALPQSHQPLAEDASLQPVFENPRVIQRAGGLSVLDAWLMKKRECQWAHNDWHASDFTIMRHEPGSILLCWGCDNQLRDHSTERLAGIARKNLVSWLLNTVSGQLGFSEDHVLTLPEFCWWLVKNGLADVIPESMAIKALRIQPEPMQSVMRESDITPSLQAVELLQEKAKKIVAMKLDPYAPESFMLKPKRRRWENEKYTRWVKTQQCMCCNNPADDPHHLIGHGPGWNGYKGA